MDIDIPSEQGIKDYLVETMNRTNSKSLLEYAAAHPVFFYPGCDCDWNSVARFSDVCRVFIFCSDAKHKPKFPPFALEDCPNSLKNLFVAGACGFLNSDVLRREGNLSSFREGRWMRVERKIEVKFGESRNANTLCKIERRLFLVFLEADPVEVFQRLFVEKGVGPMFVCLHRMPWPNRFRDLLLNASNARPKYLVGKWPKIYTPWTLLWQKYHSWADAAVFQRLDTPLLHVQEAVPFHNLHWVNTPLNPGNAHGADAVHLDIQQYLAHRWPDHIQNIFIDASAARFPAEFWAADPRLLPLRLSGLPMHKALPKLADACYEARIQNIHTGRFGFEDESGALRSVWPAHCPSVLTIHYETGCELSSLQGFDCNDLPPPARPVDAG